MAQYQVDVTDDLQVTLDVSPNAPVLSDVQFSWRPDTPEALKVLVDGLGFDVAHMDPTKEYHWRYLRLRRDGEEIGNASIELVVGASLRRTVPQPVPALKALVDEARAAARVGQA